MFRPCFVARPIVLEMLTAEGSLLLHAFFLSPYYFRHIASRKIRPFPFTFP